MTLAFFTFAVQPIAETVIPPPDGAYPGGNTAEGQNALLSLTTGTYNTAVGWFSLRSNTLGQLNTAVGAGTLFANTPNENTATGAGALLSNTTGGASRADGAFTLFLTRKARTTLLSDIERFSAILLATTTRQLALVRSLLMPRATRTQRWVVARSF